MNFLLILIALFPDDVRILLREYSCSSLLGEKSKRHFPPSCPLHGKDNLWSKKQTDEPTNRRSSWRTDGRTSGRTNRQTDGVLNGRTHLRMDRKTDRPTDGSIEKRTGGQTSERTDRGKDKQTGLGTDGQIVVSWKRWVWMLACGVAWL